jgi:hypothetical protein
MRHNMSDCVQIWIFNYLGVRLSDFSQWDGALCPDRISVMNTNMTSCYHAATSGSRLDLNPNLSWFM